MKEFAAWTPMATLNVAVEKISLDLFAQEEQVKLNLSMKFISNRRWTTSQNY